MKSKQLEPENQRRSKRSRAKMAITKITLTPRESQLRNLLLDVAHYIDESKEIKESIELRFAGGWVRDKLLGIESHDIDTAINAMTGYTFSLKMKEYLEDAENLTKHVLEAKDVGNLHKIAANPEKSKHLETVTTKIFGFDVDFVNLRKETYSHDSRNPQMEFGTAEEDAERRDATINALFYNLHSDQVEDFTGGLEDLQARRIRTPLKPHTTFMDDPLRVLRLIRFASRLDFNIAPESEAAMSNPSVMEALKLKISRERVGIELEKMLKGQQFPASHRGNTSNRIAGQNPKSALEYFDRLSLYPTVFTDPTAKNIAVPDITNWHYVYNCLHDLKTHETPGSIYNSLVRSEDAKYLSWILAALTPWSLIPLPKPAIPGGKASLPLGTMVAREGIKADNKSCSVITGAFKNYEQITGLKDDIKRNQDAYIHERDTVGMSIRRWDSQGGHWRLQALLALLVEAMNHPNSQGMNFLRLRPLLLIVSQGMEISLQIGKDL